MTRLIRRPRTVAMAALCALGIVFTTIALDTIRQIGVVHADTPASTPVIDPTVMTAATIDSTWSTIETYGPLWGGALIVFAAVGTFLKRNESKHWIAQGRTLAFITTGSMLLGAALTWQFHGHDTGGLLMSVFVAVKMLVSPTVGGATTSQTQPLTQPLAVVADSKATQAVKLPQSGRVRILTMLFVAAVAILAVPLIGCASSQRAETIKAALITADAARDGFLAYDASHQADIVSTATSKEDGQSKLIAYRASRDKIAVAFPAAYHAIAAAAIANDDPSLASMQAIIVQLVAAVQPFLGGK